MKYLALPFYIIAMFFVVCAFPFFWIGEKIDKK